MKKIILLVVAATVAVNVGCVNTEGGALGVAASTGYIDQKKADQIATLLVGKRVNPVEGFTRKEYWTYKGEDINVNDLNLKVSYDRDYAVTGQMMSPVGPVKPDAEINDKELKAEIEAILNAAGVK